MHAKSMFISFYFVLERVRIYARQSATYNLHSCNFNFNFLNSMLAVFSHPKWLCNVHSIMSSTTPLNGGEIQGTITAKTLIVTYVIECPVVSDFYISIVLVNSNYSCRINFFFFKYYINLIFTLWVESNRVFFLCLNILSSSFKPSRT